MQTVWQKIKNKTKIKEINLKAHAFYLSFGTIDFL